MSHSATSATAAGERADDRTARAEEVVLWVNCTGSCPESAATCGRAGGGSRRFSARCVGRGRGITTTRTRGASWYALVRRGAPSYRCSTRQDLLEVVGRHRPPRHPDRLDHRRRQRQRQRPAQTDPASGRRPRPARRHQDPPPRPRLRQPRDHHPRRRARTHRHRLRQETPPRPGQDQETAHPRHALAGRTHQLLVLQLRPAAPQHRPNHPPTPRPDRPAVTLILTIKLVNRAKRRTD